MTSKRLALVLLSASVALSAPVWAADPTSEQIYEAAKAGHLAQAQEMVDQVLKNHPNNAKAHYVAAEVYAREGNFGVARSQLQQAETIDPTGSYANPRSIQELKSELATAGRTAVAPPATYVVPAPAHARESHFPLLGILIVVAAVGLLWMVFRRRSYSSGYGEGMPAALGPRPFGPGGGGGYAPGYGPGYGAPPMAGGGIGSGIVGGLASGLAVGAGVVAGEELAHHFLDGNERREEIVAAPPAEPPQNSDMGGNDFGVNDPGSWDDSGSGGDGGGGGGGDDWT